jgi:hypothetical protein
MGDQDYPRGQTIPNTPEQILPPHDGLLIHARQNQAGEAPIASMPVLCHDQGRDLPSGEPFSTAGRPSSTTVRRKQNRGGRNSVAPAVQNDSLQISGQQAVDEIAGARQNSVATIRRFRNRSRRERVSLQDYRGVGLPLEATQAPDARTGRGFDILRRWVVSVA